MTEKQQDVEDLDPAVVDFDLDAELAELPKLKPYTFRLGGRPWTVQPPDVGVTVDAEKAPFLEDFFKALMGHELWREFEPVFRAVEDPSATWRLGRLLSRAFRMDPRSLQDATEEEDKRHLSRADFRAIGGRGPRNGRRK